ncbi:MAG TPA: sugar ABC transporter permease [Limnochordia bacterium]|nr:sugar ABC transporter permease [Limnochordia bacterium]
MHTRREHLAAIVTILPSIILLGIFVYGFIANSIYMSTTDWGQTAAMSLDPQIESVGLDNYRDLFTGFLNVRFRQDLVNMFFFTLLFVGLSLLVGLVLATIIDQLFWGETFFRTVFLYPMSLSMVVTGTIWRWILQPRGGINVLPTLIGLPPGKFLWLSSRDQRLVFDWSHLLHYACWVLLVVLAISAYSQWRQGKKGRLAWHLVICGVLAGLIASRVLTRLRLLPYPEMHGFNDALWGVVIAAVWQMSGYTMALYLAGLRTIPRELREAARVDGGSELQIYRYVDLPLLKPITASAIVILGHIALKIFDLIFAISSPDHYPTSMPAVTMFLKAFRGNELAVGSAIGVILFFIVSLLIVPYLIVSFRREE